MMEAGPDLDLRSLNTTEAMEVDIQVEEEGLVLLITSVKTTTD